MALTRERKVEIRLLMLRLSAGKVDRGELPFTERRSDHVLNYAKRRIAEIKRQEDPTFRAKAWTEDNVLTVIRC